jgi:hypothetical protein
MGLTLGAVRRAGSEGTSGTLVRIADAAVSASRHSVPKEREHGKDPAVVVLGVGQLELLDDRLHIMVDRRNLHDGAQQRLTSALLCLGRVRAASSNPDPMPERAVDELSTGLDEIRDLANGLHPSILMERGLAAALKSPALRSPVPVDVNAQLEDWVPEQVEDAAYYVVAEALANVHKHAGARRVGVRAAMRDGMLDVSVDDGTGGADAHGRGLRGARRPRRGARWPAQRREPSRSGTRLRAEIPSAQARVEVRSTDPRSAGDPTPSVDALLAGMTLHWDLGRHRQARRREPVSRTGGIHVRRQHPRDPPRHRRRRCSFRRMAAATRPVWRPLCALHLRGNPTAPHLRASGPIGPATGAIRRARA